MRIGDVVRFRNPMTDDERVERFVVVEPRGARVLVRFVCDLPIAPTFVYLATDLEVA